MIVGSIQEAHGGLRFERLPDGTVRITQQKGAADWARWDVDENTWASLVCTVSDRGEDHYRWYQAQAFHTESRIADWLSMVGDPIRHLLEHVAGRLVFGMRYDPLSRQLRLRFRSDGTIERVDPPI